MLRQIVKESSVEPIRLDHIFTDCFTSFQLSCACWYLELNSSQTWELSMAQNFTQFLEVLALTQSYT